MTNRIKAILTALLVLMAVSAMAGTAAAEELPDAWDVRDVDGVNCVSSIKAQGACGACFAFAAVGAFETFMMYQGAPEYDLSEEQAKMCSGGSCDGGVPEYAVSMFAIAGSVSEQDNPYAQYDTTCIVNNTPVARVTGYKKLYYTDHDSVKSYIYKYGHVISGLGGHSVVIVGWNDTSPPPYGGDDGFWIVKNSFGTGMGYDGWYYYPYDHPVLALHAISITGYEYYDSAVRTATNVRKAGQGAGFPPSNSAWGMSLLEIEAGEGITKIEFETTGPTYDIDLYIYDGYDGTSLGNLLYQVNDLSYDASGMYSVNVNDSVVFDVDTEVAIVGQFSNSGTDPNIWPIKPIAVEVYGEVSGKTYISPTGADGTWSQQTQDVTLRLRVTSHPKNGDIDGDGDVDLDDTVYLARHYYGVELFPDHGTIYAEGDIDCDGNIDMDDVVYLARHYYGVELFPDNEILYPCEG